MIYEYKGINYKILYTLLKFNHYREVVLSTEYYNAIHINYSYKDFIVYNKYKRPNMHNFEQFITFKEALDKLFGRNNLKKK